MLFRSPAAQNSSTQKSDDPFTPDGEEYYDTRKFQPQRPKSNSRKAWKEYENLEEEYFDVPNDQTVINLDTPQRSLFLLNPGKTIEKFRERLNALKAKYPDAWPTTNQ